MVFFSSVGVFLMVSCMAQGVLGWKKGRQGREGRESDRGQEAVCICQCLFQSPHPSQPCSAPGRVRLGGPTGEPGWAQAVQQLCPAPRRYGAVWPWTGEVPWCSQHSLSVLPGTVGPYWPKTAGRSIVPRWSP